MPQLQERLIARDSLGAEEAYESLREHTSSATATVNDPMWGLASALPWIGPNFGATSEIARSANDVVELGVGPLVNVFTSLDWESVLPTRLGADLAPIQGASQKVAAASHAVKASSDRLNNIEATHLLPEIAQPLVMAQKKLTAAAETLEVASDAAQLLPQMMGSDSSRHYLLMIQNIAETRASGGIPGALAVLTFENGHMSFDQQSSAAALGIMAPVVPVDRQQQQIYSSRLGKYMQDVNLTPDFPTAAATAQAMWERKTGQRVDGVISIDPAVLSYILQSTGPVALNGPELAEIKASGLPTELTGENVVPTLLSDVYARIQQPELQDSYFAGVAKEVFTALSSGKGEPKDLIAGITRGTEERRVLVWSSDSSEQSVLAKYPVSGSISGASVSPAQFGLYFNDGTGAKMDYYVKRTVQLIKECPADGYEQTTVRVTSTNTAPADAATSLPAYVTGAGIYGVAAGSVQTNIVAYGPVQANVESATIDGVKAPFAPYLHADRPVGVVAQQLAPGESKTVEFTFGKIVQHTEPNLVVTPSVQAVKDVIRPTANASCDPGQSQSR
ncbi:DUF4012 domain-containing protein [Arthrobacter sp. SLBN-112]|uniref:DUF4012 domain-containing protein n=1 Tax=Arthrobacter sp. SLBN-112 TaxID=2768452 RepID=UPI001F42C8CC|nr:DUF4012 domain-containing protein [Arthrobacter sp. SLBN-112]